MRLWLGCCIVGNNMVVADLLQLCGVVTLLMLICCGWLVDGGDGFVADLLRLVCVVC